MKTPRQKAGGRTPRGLDPKLIAIYRNYPTLVADHSIACLPSFLLHAELFTMIGDPVTAAAAERAWWGDAVILAAERTDSADQARRKIEALSPAVGNRAWRIADEGLRALTTMVTVAIDHERRRWGIDVPTAH